jgi:hypothetical protein
MATDTPEAVAEAAPEVVEEAAPVVETQAAPETPAFDPSKIDPAVKSHFEKEYGEKYKDYEQAKARANQFAQIESDPRYREWVQSLNAPKKPEPFKLTEQEHTEMLGDPNKASEIIARAAQRAADEKYGPQIEQLKREAQFAKASNELADCVKRHPEFTELDKNGHILPVLQQYPGISFDDALAIAKQKTGWVQKAAALEAAQTVETKKRAMTEKPGSSRAAKGKKSFASREDAMVYVMEQARLGNDVDEDDLDIS